MSSGRLIANSRIGLVNNLDGLGAEERFVVRVDLKQLHARVAEYQVWMLLERFKERKIRVSKKIISKLFNYSLNLEKLNFIEM